MGWCLADLVCGVALDLVDEGVSVVVYWGEIADQVEVALGDLLYGLGGESPDGLVV